ncbi:hypothetical protein Tco_0801736 [Tanacetum coccineum]|uniref:Uncharacterized protein n=1 Tax=Tanacetum coccineum TaxID=301880 RepID=A0ABQ4ZX15_9ASTR
MRRVNTFVPIVSEVDRAVLELATGSSKRNVEEELDQESSKRQKTAFDMDDLVMLWNLVKEKFKSTEPTDDKEREIWVELKRERNRHLHTSREGVSIVKRNSYIDVGCKALGGSG